MEPFSAAFSIGIHYARVDRAGTAPWPGWFPIRFDRTDPSDPDCRFTVSQPETGNPRLSVVAGGGGFLTADFTEFGGSVCEGFYCSPAADGWGGYQQWNGWELGGSGPEVVLVQYQDPARIGQCSPSLTVVRL